MSRATDRYIGIYIYSRRDRALSSGPDGPPGRAFSLVCLCFLFLLCVTSNRRSTPDHLDQSIKLVSTAAESRNSGLGGRAFVRTGHGPCWTISLLPLFRILVTARSRDPVTFRPERYFSESGNVPPPTEL